MLARGQARGLRRGGGVEQINKWLAEWAETPVGSLTVFVLVYGIRLIIAELANRRKRRKRRAKKGQATG